MPIDGIQIKTQKLKGLLQTTHGRRASQNEHANYNYGWRASLMDIPNLWIFLHRESCCIQLLHSFSVCCFSYTWSLLLFSKSRSQKRTTCLHLRDVVFCDIQRNKESHQSKFAITLPNVWFLHATILVTLTKFPPSHPCTHHHILICFENWMSFCYRELNECRFGFTWT
jgi:hypothetical protein